MKYPQTLYTDYGTFSFSHVEEDQSNSEIIAVYKGNELITHELIITAVEYEGELIAHVPNIFKDEDGIDDLIRYFSLDTGSEIP